MNEILLKLHRMYSENETISLQKLELNKTDIELSRLRFEMGELKSRLAEVEYQLDILSDKEYRKALYKYKVFDELNTFRSDNEKLRNTILNLRLLKNEKIIN